MEPPHTVILALTATASAIQAPEDTPSVPEVTLPISDKSPDFEIKACGTNICSEYVAEGNAKRTLSFMWGQCIRYSCRARKDVGRCDV